MILDDGKTLELGNDLGQKAYFKIDGEEPYIVLDTLGQAYKLTYNNIDELKKFVVGEWVEIVTKEDLKSMLQTVLAMKLNLIKQRDATVEAVNRLDAIYERYYVKEKDNESGT